MGKVLGGCNRILPSWIKNVLKAISSNWAPGEAGNNSGYTLEKLGDCNRIWPSRLEDVLTAISATGPWSSEKQISIDGRETSPSFKGNWDESRTFAAKKSTRTYLLIFCPLLGVQWLPNVYLVLVCSFFNPVFYGKEKQNQNKKYYWFETDILITFRYSRTRLSIPNARRYDSKFAISCFSTFGDRGIPTKRSLKSKPLSTEI